MKNNAYNMLPFGAGLTWKKKVSVSKCAFAYTFRKGGIIQKLIKIDTSIFSNSGMKARFSECNLLHKFEFGTK